MSSSPASSPSKSSLKNIWTRLWKWPKFWRETAVYNERILNNSKVIDRMLNPPQPIWKGKVPISQPTTCRYTPPAPPSPRWHHPGFATCDRVSFHFLCELCGLPCAWFTNTKIQSDLPDFRFQSTCSIKSNEQNTTEKACNWQDKHEQVG